MEFFMDLLKTFFTNVNYDIGAMLKDDQILFFVVSEKPILNLFIRLLFQFTVFLNKVSPQSPPCQKSGEQNFWSCFFAFECVRADFSSLTGKR